MQERHSLFFARESGSRLDEGVYEEFNFEIQRRIAEVGAGTVKTIPWSDALPRLILHLRGER
jgi:hypothetical protein